MAKSKGVGKVNKGASSGLIISILVHLGAFALAGVLVVVSVIDRDEVVFEAPKPVERPKMKLKKPKVQVKKNSRPKSASRIVTKVQKASMPDIRLPEMSGVGEGFAGGLGEGFELAPNLEQMTVFGAPQSIGNDLVGTFYDLKRDRNGNDVGMDVNLYASELGKFCRRGWKPSALSKYYRSPRKLYATSICVPHVSSTFAPFAFNEPDTQACQWAVHYTGKLVYPEDIKIRFWGHGDDVLIVRVDGKVVLDASWDSDGYGARTICGENWVSQAAANRTWYLGNNLAWGGDWIELKAGEPLDMDVLLGEQPGGNFCAMLLVEEYGAEYETNPQNEPLFPIFRTAETSHDMADAIMEHLVEGEADVLGGPVFRDYMVTPKTNEVADVEDENAPEEEEVAPEPEPAMRLWTLNDGKTFEAEYITVIGDKVVFRSAKGSQVKVPVKQISQADIDHVKLMNPPKFGVDIIRSSKSFKVYLPSYSLDRGHLPPRVLDWTFGAKAKQLNNSALGPYNFELKLEYYAIGQQYLDADKYRILDHGTATFVPGEQPDGAFRFTSEREVRVFDFNLIDQRRGMKVAETMVLLTDPRGEIIAHSSTANWLFDNLEELRKRGVNNYINKDCVRVYPTGPRQNPKLY